MKPAATPADRNKASAPAPARFGRPMAGTARRDLPNAVLVDAQGSGCSRSHASTGGRRTGTSTSSKQHSTHTHARTTRVTRDGVTCTRSWRARISRNGLAADYSEALATRAFASFQGPLAGPSDQPPLTSDALAHPFNTSSSSPSTPHRHRDGSQVPLAHRHCPPLLLGGHRLRIHDGAETHLAQAQLDQVRPRR